MTTTRTPLETLRAFVEDEIKTRKKLSPCEEVLGDIPMEKAEAMFGEYVSNAKSALEAVAALEREVTDNKAVAAKWLKQADDMDQRTALNEGEYWEFSAQQQTLRACADELDPSRKGATP